MPKVGDLTPDLTLPNDEEEIQLFASAEKTNSEKFL